MLSTVESRALLDQYKRSAAAANRERHRGAMASSSLKLAFADVTSLVIGQYESAMQRKAYDEAINCLLEAIRLGEARHDILFNVAALFQHRGSYVEAVEYFTKAIRDDPLHAEDYLRRSECFTGLNEFKNAFEELEKYFKLEPPTKALLVKCGKLALDAELFTEAEHYLTSALRFPSTDSDSAANDGYACFNLGELYERQQDDSRAAEYFEKVTQLDKGFAEPYIKQANREFEAGDFQMALHLYEAVAKICPRDPSVYIRLADVYSKLGDEFSLSVLSSLTKAIELTSEGIDFERCLVRRGILHYQIFQNIEDAIADFSLCIDMNPSFAEPRLHRAAVYKLRGSPGDANQAVADYGVVVTLPIAWQEKAEPFRVLAQYEADRDNSTAASQFMALATLWNGTSPKDFIRSTAWSARSQSANTPPLIGEEPYEPRQYVVVRDDKARKQQEAALAARGLPILPLMYQIVDHQSAQIRDREPTVHNAIECEIVESWRRFKDEVDKIREEDTSKSKKGKKK